jgi:hypothetical protein
MICGSAKLRIQPLVQFSFVRRRDLSVDDSVSSLKRRPLPQIYSLFNVCFLYNYLVDILRSLCILVGLGWLFVLPLDEFSRRSYISENALLPGQVEAYFGGSELNIIRAYRAEVESWASSQEPDL